MPEAPLHADPHIAPMADYEPFWTTHRRHRLAWILGGVLVVVLLAVVPPLISVNRYQRRVASSISGSLGRPVHFDSLSVHLLPLPGITIQNFEVGESPDFGAEPAMRANIVTARLRFSSLWRRRIEVSRISLENPSINLVRRRSDGAWNLQGILMQASHMNSAPTGQAKAGDAPRFPYIEATDARINIKSDNDKLPFTFKETELALWLPEPDEWHLRLTGRPVRTDTDVSDVGLVRVEATLGRAANLAAAPIELSATWKPTPLGEAGKLTAGYDLGWRGDASAEATLKGTLGGAKLIADLHLTQVRRADFVPEHTAEVNAHCEATTGGLLRSLTDLRCAIPTNTDTSMFAAIDFLRKAPEIAGRPVQTDQREPLLNEGNVTPDAPVKPGVLLVHGDIPNVLDWRSATVDATLQEADPNYALAWARLFSRRIPRDFVIGGTLRFTLSSSPLAHGQFGWHLSAGCDCIFPNAGPVAMSNLVDATGKPLKADAPTAYWTLSLRNEPDSSRAVQLVMQETLGGSGKEGLSSLNGNPNVGFGTIDKTGYRVSFTNTPEATQAAVWFPPLGDDMPVGGFGRLDRPTVERAWNGPQTWTTEAVPVGKSTPRRHRKK